MVWQGLRLTIGLIGSLISYCLVQSTFCPRFRGTGYCTNVHAWTVPIQTIWAASSPRIILECRAGSLATAEKKKKGDFCFEISSNHLWSRHGRQSCLLYFFPKLGFGHASIWGSSCNAWSKKRMIKKYTNTNVIKILVTDQPSFRQCPSNSISNRYGLISLAHTRIF